MTEASIGTLREEQAALRSRVRHKLAACMGNTIATPGTVAGNGNHTVPLPMTMPIDPMMAHTVLQRALLKTLVEVGPRMSIPVRSNVLLHQVMEHDPQVAAVGSALGPGNVERALHELCSMASHALRVDRGVLIGLDPLAIADFQARLMGASAPPRGPPSAGPDRGPPVGQGGPRPLSGAEGACGGTAGCASSAGGCGLVGAASSAHEAGLQPSSGAGGTAAGSKKRGATAVIDDELSEVLDLVDKKSTKQQEKQGETDELLDLLNFKSAGETSKYAEFRTVGGSKLKEFCRSGTKEDCARVNGTGCEHIHFKRIIRPHTDVSLGDCSYLDTCRHMDKCKFIHYEVDHEDAEKMRSGGAELDPFGRAATNKLAHDPFSRHYESQFVNCDIRTFPMPVLGKFPVIMADPPWDIHMELPYGTMADDEMRRMNVQVLQDDGVIFLWVTGRAMELGHECLDIWGYRFVQELLWVKTNQLQRIIRTGRTGHWINHSKEHCLVGIKGNPKLNNDLDCDVVCAEVRETSRKPDEMYDLLERLAPGSRKLELFGRPHNVHKGWTTLGNQLGKTCITEPWLREHLLKEGVFVEDDLHPLPTPPADPIVPPWGGHPPPPSLKTQQSQ